MGRRAIAQAIARGATSEREASLEARIAALEAWRAAIMKQNPLIQPVEVTAEMVAQAWRVLRDDAPGRMPPTPYAVRRALVAASRVAPAHSGAKLAENDVEQTS